VRSVLYLTDAHIPADLRCRLAGEGGVPSGADLGDLRRPSARPF